MCWDVWRFFQCPFSRRQTDFGFHSTFGFITSDKWAFEHRFRLSYCSDCEQHQKLPLTLRTTDQLLLHYLQWCLVLSKGSKFFFNQIETVGCSKLSWRIRTTSGTNLMDYCCWTVKVSALSSLLLPLPCSWPHFLVEVVIRIRFLNDLLAPAFSFSWASCLLTSSRIV